MGAPIESSTFVAWKFDRTFFLKFFVSVPLATVLNVVLARDTRLSIDPFLSHPMWNSLMSIPMTIPLEPGALSTVPEN
jgi:hypothetical protein